MPCPSSRRPKPQPQALVPTLRLLSCTMSAPARLPQQPLVRISLTSLTQFEDEPEFMLDKAIAVPCQRIGKVFGRLDSATMQTVSRALVVFLGLEGAAA